MECQPRELNKEEINLAIEEKIGYEKQKQLFKRAYPLISLLRYLPLLHEEAMMYTQMLEKLDKRHPLPHLVCGRIWRSQLVLAIQQYRAGERDSKRYSRLYLKKALGQKWLLNFLKYKPSTSLAWKAYQSLELSTHVGYSGSSGDNTPESVLQMLKTYKKLAKVKS